MWLYTVPKDETQINVPDLTEKELIDEVRRLTHFMQEDSISLVAIQVLYEFRHVPAKVTLSLDSMLVPDIFILT
jgi:hypothetical protein